MNRTHTKEWMVREQVLCFRSPGGWDCPPAEDVYTAIFEEKYSAAVSEADANLLLTLLVFSRYPAELSPEIENTVGNKGFRARIYTEGADFGRLPLPDSYAADHITINNCWYPFPPGRMEEVRALLRTAGVAEPGQITIGQYIRLTRQKDSQLRISPGVKDVQFSADKTAIPPRRLRATLYPYQRTGWNWLRFIRQENAGGILADEMGLGKTLQIIALLISQQQDTTKPSLVIAPGSLLENWRREIQKFGPGLDVHVHHGADRTGFPDTLTAHQVVITSYDTVVRDQSLINGIDWDIVIADEAQAIRNPEARRSIAVKQIPRHSGFAVSGTPVENRLTDLWSIMDFCIPGLLGTRSEFGKMYETSDDGAERLGRLVAPFILRRVVRDVANDLPPKIIIPQFLQPGEDETRLYEEIRQQTEEVLRSNSSLVVLIRLRMLCAHPFLVTGGQKDGDPAANSTKYMRMVEIAEEIIINNAKMLVFTSFNEMNDIIRDDFRRRFDVPVWSIDGRTPISSRQGILDDFSETKGAAALVLNPLAAGTGLNITAANHVIHYNPEWNPAKEDQASARAHRRGQDRPVTIHRLLYADTVEEVIDERLSRKRALASSAVVGVQGNAEDYNDLIKAIHLSPKR